MSKAILGLTIGFLLSLGVLSLLAVPALGQGSIDDGKEALTKKAYPWYDADTDGTRSMELGERPSARSANRNEIPLRKMQAKKSTNNFNPAATGGGGGGGNFGNAFLSGISALTWAIVIALVLLVIVVLVWAMMRMNSDPELDDDAVPRRSMAESIKQLPFELDSPTGDFRQQAHAAYSASDYRRAMTYLFSHVLVTLDQKGLIRLRKGKTNRQYLNELRSYRPLANYYQHVMVPFEATFFGDHELTKGEFEGCWNKLDEFQSGVDQASRNSVTSQTRLDRQVANA